jgi:transglutaminase/protease-like cytokinesis protein 3
MRILNGIFLLKTILLRIETARKLFIL